MQHVEVKRSFDELHQQRWSFWFNDTTGKLILANYHNEARATKRHQFRDTQFYERIDKRRNTIADADVPLPDDVKAEAIQLFTAQITVEM